jgi:DNA polymerase II small subunit/DNA polymerase delta subunit B
MNKEILKFSIENGFLLDKDILNFLQDLDDTELAKQILDKVSHLAKKKVITKTLIEENPQIYQSIFTEVNGEKKKIVERYFVKVSLSVEVTKEREISSIPNVNSSVKILSSPILASQKLETKDFIRHFRNRYSFYKNLLQSREELKFLTSIDRIGNNNEFSIIGMVLEKRITKNKNVILEVEDLTGRIKVLINQNREEVYEKSKEILVDDVIALKCSGSRDFVYVNDLFSQMLFVV